MKSKSWDYDVIVIGSGPAGQKAAIQSAQVVIMCWQGVIFDTELSSGLRRYVKIYKKTFAFFALSFLSTETLVLPVVSSGTRFIAHNIPFSSYTAT